MGTVFQVPWTYVEGDWIGKLRDLGYKTAAMALRDDSYSIDAPELRAVEKLAVALGSEGDGLTDGTIAGVKQTSLNLYQMERMKNLNPELVIYKKR